jgi:hypothetical protein
MTFANSNGAFSPSPIPLAAACALTEVSAISGHFAHFTLRILNAFFTDDIVLTY